MKAEVTQHIKGASYPICVKREKGASALCNSESSLLRLFGGFRAMKSACGATVARRSFHPATPSNHHHHSESVLWVLEASNKFCKYYCDIEKPSLAHARECNSVKSLSSSIETATLQAVCRALWDPVRYLSAPKYSWFSVSGGRIKGPPLSGILFRAAAFGPAAVWRERWF